MERRSFLRSAVLTIAGAFAITQFGAGPMLPLTAIPKAYELIADGKTDDTEAMQALVDGHLVKHKGQFITADDVPPGEILLTKGIIVPPGRVVRMGSGTLIRPRHNDFIFTLKDPAYIPEGGIYWRAI